TQRLHHRVPAGDHLVPTGALRPAVPRPGLAALLLGRLALASRVVGPVLGLGRGPLAAQRLAAVPAGTDLRPLLAAGAAHRARSSRVTGHHDLRAGSTWRRRRRPRPPHRRPSAGPAARRRGRSPWPPAHPLVR